MLLKQHNIQYNILFINYIIFINIYIVNKDDYNYLLLLYKYKYMNMYYKIINKYYNINIY